MSLEFLVTKRVQLYETNDFVFRSVMGMRLLDLVYVSSLMDPRVKAPEGDDYQTSWTLKDFRNLHDFFHGGVCTKAANTFGRNVAEIFEATDEQLRPYGLNLRTATLYLNALIARQEKKEAAKV